MPSEDPDKKPDHRCENCRYCWRQWDHDFEGDCRRYSPFVGDEDNGAEWPRIRVRSHWCGDWTPIGLTSTCPDQEQRTRDLQEEIYNDFPIVKEMKKQRGLACDQAAEAIVAWLRESDEPKRHELFSPEEFRAGGEKIVDALSRLDDGLDRFANADDIRLEWDALHAVDVVNDVLMCSAGSEPIRATAHKIVEALTRASRRPQTDDHPEKDANTAQPGETP